MNRFVTPEWRYDPERGNPLDGLTTHQRQAEYILCAHAMVEPATVREAAAGITGDMFADQALCPFWEDILSAEQPTDQTGFEIANKHGITSELLAITQTEFYPRYGAIGAFAQVIREDHWFRRVLMAASGMAKSSATRSVEDTRKLLLEAAEMPVPGTSQEHDTSDLHLRFSAGIDDTPTVYQTGLRGVDDILGGWVPATLTLIASRPGMGKTSIGYQFADHQARNGKRALFVSLEMSAGQLWERRICGDVEVDPSMYRRRRLTDEQREKLAQASLDYQTAIEDRLIIVDTAPLDIAGVAKAIQSARPQFVVVDHLGLVKHSADSDVQGLHEIAWGLKILAKQFSIPVLGLYQLNRGVETRDNKRPQMSDLRGSGRLEEDADNVAFLYRQDYYTRAEGLVLSAISDTEFIVQKNRSGAQGYCKLAYHLRKQRFAMPATEEDF